MSALSKDVMLPVEEGVYGEYPVAETIKIYEGAVVSLSSGYAKGYAGTDTIFLGIAERQADNSAGSNGDIRVKVRRDIHYRQVTLGSAALTDVGADLYASDDATFTKTSTDNLPVGKVHRYVAADTIIAKFTPAA